MPPRNPELPEGTDHIINGAMDTGGGGGSDFGTGAAGAATSGTTASTGLGGGGSTDLGGSGGGTGASGTGGGSAGGGASSGFVASGGTDDTGGTTGGTGGGTAGGGSGAPVTQQLRDGVQGLKSQAGDRIRSYAIDGKERASTALDDFAQVVTEAADSIEERLGSEYGQYARRAADAVSGYAENLRGKDVDELFDDARNLVRRSPGVAIGAAAAVGFVLVRLIKSGIDGNNGGGRTGGGTNDVDFQPDAQLAISPETGASAAGTSA